MTLVVDASVAATLCVADEGFALVADALIAPVLLRSEVLSALRSREWRGEISAELAMNGMDRLLTAPVQFVNRTEVWRRAAAIATSLGWAKTYDAEYVALAQLRGVALLTLDQRMRRRAATLVEVLTPSDLVS